jgi:hypothetical protein
MKAITIVLTLVFSLALNSSNAQQSTLEQALATSACKHLDKVNLNAITTQEQKKNTINLVFAQAVKDNEKLLKTDKRFKGLSGYEQGKQIGVWISQSVFPAMMKDCPRFASLMKK